MPFAVKKPHPVHPNVKLWHSWDPDGDGYEEIRKFKTSERAQEWIDENHPNKSCEIVEVPYEAAQTDEEIEMKDRLAEDPTTHNGVRSYRNKDNEELVGKLTTFTVDGELDD
jgi:hypothetical protein